MFSMTHQLITIETFRTLPDAVLAQHRLEHEGITVFLADQETVNMDWFLGNAIGQIKLQVPDNQAVAAKTIVDQMQRDRQTYDSRPDDPRTTACLSCGAAMPDDSTRCAACGWSYESDESEPAE
jgi:hypothetical protein